MELFKKYEFNSQEQAEDKIAALPHITDNLTEESYLEGDHTIVKLGYLVTNTPEWDEEGNAIVEPEHSDKYSVDVLWQGLDESPYGWKSYEIEVEGNGAHSFLGRNFGE
jgi:hypothetical protein